MDFKLWLNANEFACAVTFARLWAKPSKEWFAQWLFERHRLNERGGKPEDFLAEAEMYLALDPGQWPTHILSRYLIGTYLTETGSLPTEKPQ